MGMVRIKYKKINDSWLTTPHYYNLKNGSLFSFKGHIKLTSDKNYAFWIEEGNQQSVVTVLLNEKTTSLSVAKKRIKEELKQIGVPFIEEVRKKVSK
jgi:hypothetical protein